MSLRQKTLLIVGATLIGLLVTLYVSSRAILLEGFVRLENQQARRDTERALAALLDDLNGLEMTAGDWAAWDDTYAFIQDHNEAYVRSNLVDGTFVQNRLNLLLLVDSSGKMVFGRGFDLTSEEEEPVPEALREGSPAYEAIVHHTDPASSITGTLLLPTGPVLIASHPILTSHYEGPIRGALVMGRRLDAAEVERLARLTRLSLSLHPFDDPAPAADLESARALLSGPQTVAVRPLSDTLVAGYALVPGVNAKPALILRATMPREVYAEGQATITYFVVCFVVAGAILATVTFALPLRRMLLSRMQRLSDGVRRIGASGDLSTRINVGGDDELSHLTEAINKMLAALQRSEAESQQAQRELRESEGLLRNVVENVPIGIWVADRDFHLRLWNVGQEAMTGVRRDQVLGRSIFACFPRLAAAGLEERYRRVVETGEPLALDGFLLRDPTLPRPQLYLNIRANPLRSPTGEITGIVVAAEDITARRRVEQVQSVAYRIAAAASRGTNLQQLLPYIRQELGTVIDTQNFYIALYDSAEDLVRFPYYVDETLAAPGIATDYVRKPARGLTEYVMRTAKPLLLTTEAIGELAQQGEIELIGALPRVWLGAPLQSDGKTIGVIAVQSYTDEPGYTQEDLALLSFISGQVAVVAERKQAEELLQQQSAAMQASMDGMAVLDRNERYIYLNEAHARVYGYDSPAELVGKSWRILYHADELRRFEAEIMPALYRQGHWRGEATGRKRDGSTFPQELSLTLLPEGGLVCVVRDVSERKRLEEQLRHSQKMEAIGRLAGGVAHDFNNLLTAITGYSTFARDALPPSDPAREDIGQVLKAADRAADLTRQLLAFARRQIIAPHAVNLNEVILNLDKMLRRLISEDIELITIPAPNLGAVKVDPGQIEQILVNLVVNARDAMPEGGRLTIETGNVTLDEEYARQHVSVVPGEYVLLAVSDTGHGMTEEVKAHLFEPFFTTKEPGKGTGLGLATCFGIVKQNRGNIWVYSEPGRGTTFKIYFPRVEADTEELPQRPETENYRCRAERSVLVVEDEPAVRSFAVRVLQQMGYTVYEAANGPESLEVVAGMNGAPLHLLVTDVVMPQGSGAELSEHLKALYPEVKTLYISGYTANAIVRQGVLKEGVAFLQKPFTAGDLARKVREMLS